jgi:hypothetical protein
MQQKPPGGDRMRAVRWLSALAVLFITACNHPVSSADFEAFKTSVKTSGEAVDAWIAQAHEVVTWVAVNGSKFCKLPDVCDPPTPPPPPPPNGEWGS